MFSLVSVNPQKLQMTLWATLWRELYGRRNGRAAEEVLAQGPG